MSIKITGSARLSIDYEITLNMSEERFNELSARDQQHLINQEIPWQSIMDYCCESDIELSISEVLRKQKNRSSGSGFVNPFENNLLPTL